MGWDRVDRLVDRMTTLLTPTRSTRDGTREPSIGHAVGCGGVFASFFGCRRGAPEGTPAGPTPKQSSQERPVSAQAWATVASIETRNSALMDDTEVVIRKQLAFRYTTPKQWMWIPDPKKASAQAGPIDTTLFAPGEVEALMARAAARADRSAHEDLVRRLHLAWPKGVETEPAEFTALALELQARRNDLFADAMARPTLPERRDALQAAMALASDMHGKPGEVANRLAVADELLREGATQSLLIGATPQVEVRDALRWLSLSERKLPVAFLAANRRYDDFERKVLIAPRAQRSAQDYRDWQLGPESTARLMEQTRRSDAARTLAAQFVDLVDRLAALAAKPGFRMDDRVDLGKTFDAVKRGLAADGLEIDPTLMAAVRGHCANGALDRALRQQRPRNLAVY